MREGMSVEMRGLCHMVRVCRMNFEGTERGRKEV